MMSYETREIQEKDFEDIIRRFADRIEPGLKYVDHQKKTKGGRLDVLFVDSGSALVVAELKVTEDESMLTQGIDYYDYIVQNQESFARAYTKGEISISPTERPRLFLIAPSFSVPLLNRCKWIDIPLSLFTFKCIVLKDKPKDVIPVFYEVPIPPKAEPVEISTIEWHLGYITDQNVRITVEKLLEEITGWDNEAIKIDPISDYLSMKVNNRVFGYLASRRKHFIVETYDIDGEWRAFAIHTEEELEKTKTLLKSNYESYKHQGSVS